MFFWILTSRHPRREVTEDERKGEGWKLVFNAQSTVMVIVISSVQFKMVSVPSEKPKSMVIKLSERGKKKEGN